jgi:hypothetical protein
MRSQKHLEKIRQHPCLICGVLTVDAHHLRIDMSLKGMGMKPGDEYAVPLCRTHHRELHDYGNERLWWALQGIDPMEWLRERDDR